MCRGLRDPSTRCLHHQLLPMLSRRALPETFPPQFARYTKDRFSSRSTCCSLTFYTVRPCRTTETFGKE